MPTYREWEDNDVPYGFLITFRTYGTWLHGDERGSVDRNNNVYGTPRIRGSKRREAYRRSLMKAEPVSLDAEMRNSFKAYATRKMRERGCWLSDRSPWVEKGSQRVLWNAKSLEGACEYVIHGQGADLDDFDKWLSKRQQD